MSAKQKLYKAFMYKHGGRSDDSFEVLERVFSNIASAKNFICNNMYDVFYISDERFDEICRKVQNAKVGDVIEPIGGDYYSECGIVETDEIPKIYDDEPAEWNNDDQQNNDEQDVDSSEGGDLHEIIEEEEDGSNPMWITLSDEIEEYVSSQRKNPDVVTMEERVFSGQVFNLLRKLKPNSMKEFLENKQARKLLGEHLKHFL